jgi:hypothetical protein
MVAKIGFIVDGSGWDPANIIGSLYPQPTYANIGVLDENGVTMLAGNAPASTIGTPILGTGYQTLNSINAGYDTGIPDTTTKTIMILAKPTVLGSKRCIGIGSYHGGNGTPPTPQGDTLLINPVDFSMRTIASTATGTAQSNIVGTSLDISKFHLYIGDFSDTQTQAFAFHNGALVTGAAAAITGRAIPSSNILIGAGYDTNATNSVDAPIQEAVWGGWSGVNLTTSEKSAMYNTLVSLLGGVVSIS